MNKVRIVEPLDMSKHNLAAFSCGEEPLDTFLKERADSFVRRYLSAVHVMVEDGSTDVIGYYALSSFAVQPTDLPPEDVKRLPRRGTIPAILIGKFAIHEKLQHQGLGKMLLGDALSRCMRNCRQISAASIIVDALNENVVVFYEARGFRRVLDQENPLRLFLMMSKVERLLST